MKLGMIMGITALLILTACTQATDTQTNEPVQNKQEQVSETTNENSLGSDNTITSQELSLHANKNDCWVVFEDKVYDVTNFLPKHPGGENAIAQYCGGDQFESGFVQQHGYEKVSKFMKETDLQGTYKKE